MQGPALVRASVVAVEVAVKTDWMVDGEEAEGPRTMEETVADILRRKIEADSGR